MVESDSARQGTNAGLVRVEELYPFPAEQIRSNRVRANPHVRESAVPQEEPRNMGAWSSWRARREFLAPILRRRPWTLR